jgi:hypothetical protein
MAFLLVVWDFIGFFDTPPQKSDTLDTKHMYSMAIELINIGIYRPWFYWFIGMIFAIVRGAARGNGFIDMCSLTTEYSWHILKDRVSLLYTERIDYDE